LDAKGLEPDELAPPKKAKKSSTVLEIPVEVRTIKEAPPAPRHVDVDNNHHHPLLFDQKTNNSPLLLDNDLI
jgi:hypothetical protein